MRLSASLRKAMLGMFVAFIWVACTPTPPLGPGPQETVGQGNEPSIAFAPGLPFIGNTMLPPRTIVMFNGGFVWSSTTDGSTWSPPCNANTPGFPCFVPKAPNQITWNSDPFIRVAPGFPTIVAASLLAGDRNAGDEMVTLSVSTDQGVSFSNTVQVNDVGCSSGHMDQPGIAFDPSAATPTIWAVWRYNAQAVFGICVRGGTINTTTGAVTWFGPSREVQNVNNAAFYGAGGVLVQPLGDTVTVMYTNTDHIFKDCSDGKDVKWYTNTSPDKGVNWSDSHLVFDATDSTGGTFAWCTIGGHYIRGIRSFWFERDASNTSRLWSVVNDSQSTAQVQFSTDEGKSWTPSVTLAFPSLYEPTLTTDPSGRVAVFFLGSNEDGSVMTPLMSDRRLGLPDPAAWSEPQETQVGSSFASNTLASCNVTFCVVDHVQCCGAVFNGDSPNAGNCVNSQCVGQRFGGGGDYLGITFVPAGAYGDSNERFASAWQNASPTVLMSFVDVLE